jgi:hypothetical protein
MDGVRCSGYDGPLNEIRLEVNALLAQAREESIDDESVRDQAYESAANDPKFAY